MATQVVSYCAAASSIPPPRPLFLINLIAEKGVVKVRAKAGSRNKPSSMEPTLPLTEDDHVIYGKDKNLLKQWWGGGIRIQQVLPLLIINNKI